MLASKFRRFVSECFKMKGYVQILGTATVGMFTQHKHNKQHIIIIYDIHKCINDIKQQYIISAAQCHNTRTQRREFNPSRNTQHATRNTQHAARSTQYIPHPSSHKITTLPCILLHTTSITNLILLQTPRQAYWYSLITRGTCLMWVKALNASA